MSDAFTNEDMDALAKRLDDNEITMEEALAIIAKADAEARMRNIEDE